MNLKTMASTLLLSTFLVGGMATEAEAKTYTQSEVTVKEYRNSFSYVDDLLSRQLTEGMVLMRMPDEDIGENRYAYYNTLGEKVFEVENLRYYLNTTFSDGLVLYVENEDDDITYRDKEGNVVLGPYATAYATGFSEGYAWMDTEEARIMIDTEGNILLSYDPSTPSAEMPNSFKDGLGVLGTDFVDLEGNVVLSTGYEIVSHSYMSNFSHGITSIKTDIGETHEYDHVFIDQSGTELFRKTAYLVSDFQDGFAVIGYQDPPSSSGSSNTNAGSYSSRYPYLGDVTFMDTQGNEFSERYDGVTPFNDGYAGVAKVADYDGDGKTETKWGFIDTTGTLVIDYQYDDISSKNSFSEGLALVSVTREGETYKQDYFYIDTAGNVLIEVEEDFYASSFDNGGAFLYQYESADEKGSVVFIRNPLTDSDSTPSTPTETPEVEETPEATPETDSPIYDPWAESFVEFAVENGLIVDSLGMDYTKNITRLQIADLLVNMVEQYTGETLEARAEEFPDSSNTQVLKAAQAGLITGREDGTFDPDNVASRQEMAIMVYNAIKVMEEMTDSELVDHRATTISGYSDLDTAWAKEALSVLANAGIITGDGNGTISPNATTNIQVALVMNNNLFQLS